MHLNDLLASNLELTNLLTNMPKEIKEKLLIKKYCPKSIIQMKDDTLEYFSILCQGEVNIINEFENGNQILIESNEAIDFIGEVTALSSENKVSVTIEAVSDCILLRLPLKDFFNWISIDHEFLLYLSKHISNKLYKSSYTRGVELFYPAIHLMLDFLIRYGSQNKDQQGFYRVDLTHRQISDFLGVTPRTINRVVKQLKEENLISISRGKIQVNSRQLDLLTDAFLMKKYI